MRRRGSGIIAGVVVALAFASGPFVGSPAAASEALERGSALYESGDYEAAVEALREARRAERNDPEAALLLGLAYLRLDQPGDAAVHWKDYARLAADRPLAGDVRRYVTILEGEADRRAAKEAVFSEEHLTAGLADPRTVAVTPFRNLGAPEWAPLGSALAAMLAENLSGLGGIRVLDHGRVEALLDEAGIRALDLADTSAAVRAGTLLRAGRVVTGSYIDWVASPAKVGVEVALVDVARADEDALFSGESPVADLGDLVPRMAQAVAGALDATGSGGVLGETHTGSLEAALAFGRGLELESAGDYPGAREQFERALREDPDFGLARRELEALPAVAISLAAVANAVETAETTSVAVVEGKEGMSFRTKALIVGGGIVAAGTVAGIAIASGGGGGGGDGDGDGQCLAEGTACAREADCCDDLRCTQTATSNPQSVCCVAVGQSCSPGSQSCCGVDAQCAAGRCCLQNAAVCLNDVDCCSGDCDAGFCASGAVPTSTPGPGVTPTPVAPTSTPAPTATATAAP